MLDSNLAVGFSGEALEATFRQAMDQMQAGSHAEADALLLGFSDKVASVSTSWQIGENPTSPAASIIVVSYKMVSGIEPAIAAIASQARDENCEVILIDNGNDELEAIGRRHLDGARMVKAPFQTGASVGRNLGAFFANSEHLIFIDDDGVIEAGFVESLLRAARETGSVGIRGRVVPLTEGTYKPAHYDLGDRRLPTFVSVEGASIWQRGPYRAAGGFHPLLYGHEGLDLCARLFRFHGPFAFFYEPSAVLRHDFADDPNAQEVKLARYARNTAFVESRSPKAWGIRSRVSALALDGRSAYLAARHRPVPFVPEASPVSILTTARNAAQWLDEYTASWKAQTQANFQLVFVDDGSTDGTAERIESLWRGDDRLTLVQNPAQGRGTALNTALAHAAHEVCLIADADDLSTPERIIRTTETFRRNPDVDYLSFLAFNEDELLRIGPPHSPFITDMEVRALFGMPASFPTFAFRKSRFPYPFDATLPGGSDCRWLKTNLAETGAVGRLVHEPLVYYRRHEGQITKQHNPAQQMVRHELIHWGFGRVLGPLSDIDRDIIAALTSGKALTLASPVDAVGWVASFLDKNNHVGLYDPTVVGQVLLERLEKLEKLEKLESISTQPPAQSPIEAPPVISFRRAAEKHIAAGEFKLARRALRNALGAVDAKAIARRLLSAHRYGIVRYFAKSTPFKG